jgi:hypothetical protein
MTSQICNDFDAPMRIMIEPHGERFERAPGDSVVLTFEDDPPKFFEMSWLSRLEARFYIAGTYSLHVLKRVKEMR